MVENSGPVLLAPVHELALIIGRVHHPPKRLQQSLVGHFVRVVIDLYRFGVASLPRGNLLVGRICLVATGIAGDSFHHARHPFFVPGFDTPETATSESCHRQAWLIRCILAHLRLRLFGNRVGGEQPGDRDQRQCRKYTHNFAFHQTSPLRDSIPKA